MSRSPRTPACFAVFATVFVVLGFAPVIFAQTEQNQNEYAAAVKLRDAGDLKGAEAALTQLLERLPENRAVLLERAWVRLTLQKSPAAMEDLDRCISFWPREPAGYLMRAQARLQLRNYASALNDANLAVKFTTNKKDDQPFLIRARLLRNLERAPEAQADYDRVLAINPDNPEVLAYRGEMRLAEGAAASAQVDLSRAAKNLPTNAGVFARLGEAEFALAHFDEALAACARAGELDPKPRRNLYYWGLVLFAKGDYAGATRRLREVGGPEGQIALYLAQRRGGQPADDLRPALAGLSDGGSRMFANFLLGGMKDEELLDTAKKFAGSEKERNGLTCSIYYYIGQARLLAGDRIAAKVFFQQAAAIQDTTVTEHALARAELSRL